MSLSPLASAHSHGYDSPLPKMEALSLSCSIPTDQEDGSPRSTSRACSFTFGDNADARRISTWSYTPRGAKHSLCVATDGSVISQSAFESVLKFTPKQLYVVRCRLPNEATSEAGKRWADEAVFGEMANKHNYFTPLNMDQISVKAPEEIPSAVITYAQRHKCELIAVGTRRREEHHGVHTLGYVTDSVVRQAHIPVYIVRANPLLKKCLRYVVAVDGSKISNFCIDCVRDLARSEDEIIIVSCLPSMHQAEALLQEQMSKLVPSQVAEAKITPKAFVRNPELSIADNLVEIADQLEADTLVLATGWKRSTTDLGSVTSSCIYTPKLKCNLLIYKNPKLLDVPNSSRRVGSTCL